MLPSPTRPKENPAADAARLLLRLGLLVLALGLPVAAMLSRRAVFVVFPIAAVLILLAAMLRGPELAIRHFFAALVSPVGLALLFIAGWCGLSLLWTPFFGDASDHLIKMLATGLAALAVVCALGKWTRTSDLYLVPIGVAAGAVLAIALAFPPTRLLAADTDPVTLSRGLAGLAVLVWPALGALGARQHWSLAGVLMIGVATAAAVNWAPIVLVMLACGAVAFIAMRGNPRPVSRGLGLFAGFLVLAAPALAIVADLALTARSVEASAFGQNMASWAALIKADPARLLTGHGLDAATRAVQAGFLPTALPRSLLFEIWYELGIVGAVSLATMLYFAFRAAGRLGPAAGLALGGGITACLAMVFSGQQTTQIWWITLLAIALITTSLVVRGQYRSARPAALLAVDDRAAR